MVLQSVLTKYGLPRHIDLGPDDGGEPLGKRPRTQAEWSQLETELFGSEPEEEPSDKSPQEPSDVVPPVAPKPFQSKEPYWHRCCFCGGLFGCRSSNLIRSKRIPAMRGDDPNVPLIKCPVCMKFDRALRVAVNADSVSEVGAATIVMKDSDVTFNFLPGDP